MAHIKLKNFCSDFPIYNARARSLKLGVMKMLTGGGVETLDSGIVLVHALKDLNMEINEGERVALLGHNGAGKSTLLRAFSGVYAPTSGTAEINGEISSLIDISLGIDPEATGRQNIVIRGTIMGLNRDEIEDKLEDIVTFSELGDFIDLPIRTYSTGMLMRLAFAVATSIDPEILLMDEWLSVGDADFNLKADKRMNDLVNNSKIMVMATHSKNKIETNCTRAIWLEHGQVKADGEAKEIANAYFGTL